MKNIVGVTFLILVTAHLGVAQGLLYFLGYVKLFGIGNINRHLEEFSVPTCPGICFPPTIKHMCPLVYDNAGCPMAKLCCVFSMRVELNSPNPTESTPLTDFQFTVKNPEDTTIKDIETSSEDDIIITTTNIPSTKYETIEALELEKTEVVIEKKDDEQDNISCSGVCIESRLTKYCEAYFSSTDFCKSGKFCCVPISSYGDTLPSDLVVPYKGISSSTVKQSIQTLSTTPIPEKSSGWNCTGECLSTLKAFFCDDIDNDAICEGQKTCCRKATKITTNSQTTPP